MSLEWFALTRWTKGPLCANPQMDKWYGEKGVHVWMGVSMKWKIPLECFHVFNENETVTNVTFLETMKKPHGFFSWVHRKPGAIVVLDNAPGHITARSVGVSGKINIIDWPAVSGLKLNRKFVGNHG